MREQCIYMVHAIKDRKCAEINGWISYTSVLHNATRQVCGCRWSFAMLAVSAKAGGLADAWCAGSVAFRLKSVPR